MPKKAEPKVTNVNLGGLNAGQDDAINAVAKKLSRERGSTVTRADVTREALAMFTRAHGVEWPC